MILLQIFCKFILNYKSFFRNTIYPKYASLVGDLRHGWVKMMKRENASYLVFLGNSHLGQATTGIQNDRHTRTLIYTQI